MNKFPRTPHLKGSKGTPDDIFKDDCSYKGLMIATEKMDGVNLTITNKSWYLRSGNNKNQNWTYPINNFFYFIKDKISDDYSLLGESLYWTKSIYYNNLEKDYYLFGINKNNKILEWKKTKQIAKELDIPIVKEVSRIGYFNEVVKEAKEELKKNPNMEGFVVRPIESFDFSNYGEVVRKFVREDFIGTRESKGKNNIKNEWF
jgi:hypothetical protein